MNQPPFKILYLMTEPFIVGGVQSDLKSLGPYFVGKGHEVVVACPDGDQVDFLRKGGVTHIPFSVHFRTPSQFAEQARRLKDLIRQVNPTVLAPQSIRASWICHKAAKDLPIVRVTTVHNIHRTINALWAGVILNRASHLVIFESDHEHRRITRLGLSKKKTLVIPSGIDTETFFRTDESTHRLRTEIPGLEAGDVVFGCVARLAVEKSHKDLLAAFAILRKTYPRSHLVLVGDGPLRPDLEAQSNMLGISSHVHFVGQRSNIRDYLNLFDVFVLSSIRESLPRAAREAMACGLPVIATKVGASREVVRDGHNGFLVPPCNVDQLARAMMHLMFEPDLRRIMGERSLSMIADRFSLKRWLEDNEQVYLKAGALAGRVSAGEIGARMIDPVVVPCS
ncbi:MAG: glycosyltransferase [Leptospirales bacterium]